MLNHYLTILEESLVKKLKVLEHIKEVNQAQTVLMKEKPVNLEAFDQCVDEKDLYIKELTDLDDGFEALYDKIKEELVGNREKYAEQIRRLQDLITEVTDSSVSIQAQENRNKELMAAYFKEEREALGQVRKSSKAAYGYYQNMNKKPTQQSYFMDKKK